MFVGLRILDEKVFFPHFSCFSQKVSIYFGFVSKIVTGFMKKIRIVKISILRAIF